MKLFKVDDSFSDAIQLGTRQLAVSEVEKLQMIRVFRECSDQLLCDLWPGQRDTMKLKLCQVGHLSNHALEKVDEDFGTGAHLSQVDLAQSFEYRHLSLLLRLDKSLQF